MTYIAAFARPGFNFIISDMRVTWGLMGEKQSADTALKTGVLFPGCIFGLAGNAEEGRRFVLTAKRALTGTDTVPGFWMKFIGFVASYPFPMQDCDQFELLGSSRALGTPKLWHLNSGGGLQWIPEDQQWMSIGSGKSLLDPLIVGCASQAEQFLTVSPQPSHRLSLQTYPFLLCLRLLARSQGLERNLLEDCGVGGCFHFLCQTSRGETRQPPALYVLCDADRRTNRVFLWLYRVAFAKGGLVVERFIPPGQALDAPDGKHE